MFTDEMAIVVREITVTSLRTMYTEGKVTSQNLWSPYDHHLVGKTRHNVWNQGAKIYRVVQM